MAETHVRFQLVPILISVADMNHKICGDCPRQKNGFCDLYLQPLVSAWDDRRIYARLHECKAFEMEPSGLYPLTAAEKYVLLGLPKNVLDAVLGE